METCLCYNNKEVAFFSSDERRWITKIRNLKKKYPDEVEILAKSETNDGCIYCKLPSQWMKIQPKRVYSEERKQEMIAQLKRGRESI